MMTILAGIVSRARGVSVPEPARESIRRLISRDPRDAVVESSGTEWILAKVDIGVLGGSAVRIDEGHTITMVAGEPLLLVNEDEKSQSRAHDVATLHRALGASDLSILARSTGTFCGVHYDQVNGALRLYTDKLGLRPIYYWVGTNFVAFASALRILEQMAEVPKIIDLRGVTEIASFGFPLAERTAYVGISTLRAGEAVTIVDSEVRKSEYWRWDRVPIRPATGLGATVDIYRRFMSAVERRVGDEAATVAFLSGGLDSRAIVSALRSLDTIVHTINWAPPGTQDEVFARMASDALGTLHHHLAKDADDISDRSQIYNQRAVMNWFDSIGSSGEKRPKRGVVWSGDGGSVGVGHVYLNPEIVQLAQRGQEDAAIDAFLQHNPIKLAAGLFRSGAAETIVATPKRGIKDELSRLECKDRGRAFHVFLMLNDQRRHLSEFFENIDIGRLELKLPFYDGDFLEPILTSPIDEFLGHRFYVEWLRQFSAATTSVPWQAYRGHVPCPLPTPDDLRYQWTDYYDRDTARQIEQTLLERGRSLLRAGTFPDRIIDRGRLRVVLLLTRLRLRNYGYAIRQAATFSRYWSICESSMRRDHAAACCLS